MAVRILLLISIVKETIIYFQRSPLKISLKIQIYICLKLPFAMGNSKLFVYILETFNWAKFFSFFYYDLIICLESYSVQVSVGGLTFKNPIPYSLASGWKPLINYTTGALKIKGILTASEQIWGRGITPGWSHS